MSEMFRIALAQTTAGEDRGFNRKKAEKTVARAAKEKAALVAFPEMAFDPFFPQYPTDQKYFEWAEKIPGPTCQRFADIAEANKIAVLINHYETSARGQYFDTTTVIDHEGILLGVCRMMHICETPGFHEKYYYWQGPGDYLVFEIGGARVAPCICYDRHYPEVMRILTLNGAEVIVVQTATTREEAGQVLEAEMQAAALANGVFVALVNRAGEDGELHFAGRSFVAAPDGSIIAQSKSDSDDLLIVDLELDEIERARQVWPFLRDRRPEIYDALLYNLEPEI
jgi:beta-ureidopropionase